MIIGIDGNEANEVRADIGAPAGVNVYAFDLLKSIHKLQDEWKSKFKVIVYLKNPPSELLPKPTKSFNYKILPGKGFWVIKVLTPYLFKTKIGVDRPDVLFSPSHYTPPLSPMPKVASIMDIGYLESSDHLKKKDFWQLKYWTARTIKSSKAIFAISESTKRDIETHYKSAKGKVSVTYLGYDDKRFNNRVKKTNGEAMKKVLKRYSIGLEYVLFLSVLKPNKNVEGLIKAWAKVVNKYPRYCLVIAGKKGWRFTQIFDLVKKLDLDKKIIFTDYLPEEEKPFLIAQAKLFVLPSFWEGFGHDVLHAMACGVPVALSRAGSLPEVAGGAGTYFDPKDPNDIADKIIKVLTLNKTDYNKLVEKSLKQAKKFSWEDTARKTLRVLELVSKSKI